MDEPGQPGVTPLPVFDLATFSGTFSHLLQGAGIPVTSERSVRFLDVLRLLPPADRDSLYWATRLAFVTSRDQVATFDRVFHAVFSGRLDPAGSRRDTNPPLLPGDPGAAAKTPPPPPMTNQSDRAEPSASRLSNGVTTPAGGPTPDRDGEVEARPTIASHDEVLASKDLGSFDQAELAALRRLLSALVVATPLRRTRRKRPDAGGRHIDLRRSLRQSQRTAGDPVTLVYSRNRLRRRRLVMICDVSGSMEAYTRAYLHVFQRAAAGVAAEAFVFATRLTRLTPALRASTPEVALRSAGLIAPDCRAGPGSAKRWPSSTTASAAVAWPGGRWW